MRLKKWRGGADFSLGVEFEARYIRKKDGKVSHCAKRVKSKLPKSLKPYVHDEFSPCLVEILTPVCKSVDEAVRFLQKATSTVAKVACKSGDLLIASGIYPDKNANLKVLKNRRYQKIKDEFGILLDDFSICGIHLHVGFSSHQKALKAYNFLIYYLPIFIALHANSPVQNAKDTKLLSYRLSMFDRLPRTGIPPYFQTYEKMQKAYEEYFDSGMISSFGDIWWDLRIKPEFGTLELRVCDSTHDFKRLKASFALYQALCFYAKNAKAKLVSREILAQNRWNAMRHGWNGLTEHGQTFRDLTKEIVEKMEKKGVFEFFGTQKEAKEICKFACKRTLAQEQLGLYKKGIDKILRFGEIR